MSSNTRIPKAIVITFLVGSAFGSANAGCSSENPSSPDAAASDDAAATDGADGSAPALARPWDWTSVVGTGQSLAVGQMGTPVATTIQPYGNLKLSTGMLPWPVDPDDTSLTMVPLTEPIGRPSTAYP